MKLKLVLFAFMALPYLYDLILQKVTDEKRKEPLPKAVEDIYSAERWESFLAYKKMGRTPHLLSQLVSFLLSSFLIFSPFFSWMEHISPGVYGHTILAAVIIGLISFACELPFSYYHVFTVREHFGLNKMTRKEFWKDQLLGEGFSIALAVVLYVILTWILESLPAWTNQYQVSLFQALLVMAGIVVILFAFIIGASLLSWMVMRMQYHFSDLADDELRADINDLVKESRHKVRRIEVYDESKKSTSKNAFVLKLLFYRSIGIADNFLNENSRRELLAVLAHEAGHLKHKKSFWNYLTYACLFAFFLLCTFAITKGAVIAGWENALNNAFNLMTRNTVLTVSAAGWFLVPAGALFSAFHNFVRRDEEYEADRNAVHEGYGRELIDTFRTLSSDELIDVNPADLVEIMELDHPGMAHRIAAIQTEMAKAQ